MEVDERELLRRMAAGDEDAFRAFYRRHAHSALRLARRVLQDPALAEDAVQEAFLAAWRNAARYDGSKAQPATWLLTFVHRRAVDLVRHRARRPVDSLDSARAEPLAEDAALARVPERVWLESALERLSGVERDVLELAYVVGLTQAEIAEVRNLPVGTVKSRTASALARLGTSLAA